MDFVQTRRAEITADRNLWMFGGGEPVRPLPAGEAVSVDVIPGGLAVVG